MCQKEQDAMEQKIIHKTLLQTKIKDKNKTLIVDGYCTGQRALSDILLEIAADKIQKKYF